MRVTSIGYQHAPKMVPSIFTALVVVASFARAAAFLLPTAPRPYQQHPHPDPDPHQHLHQSSVGRASAVHDSARYRYIYAGMGRQEPRFPHSDE